jgi:hypothetical protein
MDGLDHLGNTVGPGPGRLRHFASRGWEELVFASKSRWEKRRGAKVGLDGNTVGPGPGAFGTSRLAAGRRRGAEEPNRAPRVPLDGRP